VGYKVTGALERNQGEMASNGVPAEELAGAGVTPPLPPAALEEPAPPVVVVEQSEESLMINNEADAPGYAWRATPPASPESQREAPLMESWSSGVGEGELPTSKAHMVELASLIASELRKQQKADGEEEPLLLAQGPNIGVAFEMTEYDRGDFPTDGKVEVSPSTEAYLAHPSACLLSFFSF